MGVALVVNTSFASTRGGTDPAPDRAQLTGVGQTSAMAVGLYAGTS